jgi:hypothetical protein
MRLRGLQLIASSFLESGYRFRISSSPSQGFRDQGAANLALCLVSRIDYSLYLRLLSSSNIRYWSIYTRKTVTQRQSWLQHCPCSYVLLYIIAPFFNTFYSITLSFYNSFYSRQLTVPLTLTNRTRKLNVGWGWPWDEPQHASIGNVEHGKLTDRAAIVVGSMPFIARWLLSIGIIEHWYAR